jgi:hypothetical protein
MKDHTSHEADDELEEPKISIYEGTSVSLHLAVACSAAYPAFFTPVPVSYRDLVLPDGYGTQYHIDGGVIDNQGLQTILEDSSSNRLIISDASSPAVYSQPMARFGLFSSGLRSMELMMAQIRYSHYAGLSSKRPRFLKLIDIALEREDRERENWGAVYAQLPYIRTDLDHFDTIEQQELIRHGYYSAEKELNFSPRQDDVGPPDSPKELPGAVARHLRSKASLRLGLFSLRDWVSAVNTLLLILFVVFAGSRIPKVLHGIADLYAIASASGIRSRSLGKLPHRSPVATTVVKDVPRLPDDQNKGFTVTADDRVWDLTKLSLSPEKDSIIGVAYLTRYTEVRREVESAKRLGFRFETSGTIKVWSGESKHKLKFKLIAPEPDAKPTEPNGSSIVHAYNCFVEADQVPVGEIFLVVIQAEYTDAFKNRGNWWTGMFTTNQMQRAAMRIVFPLELPFHHPTFRRYPTRSHLESETFDGTAANIVGERPELLWSLEPPKPGSTYRVDWDWYPETQGENFFLRWWHSIFTSALVPWPRP